MRRVRLAAAVTWTRVEVVDVDANPDLMSDFGDRVPVVLASSGTVLAEGAISTGQAWAAVKAAWRR